MAAPFWPFTSPPPTPSGGFAPIAPVAVPFVPTAPTAPVAVPAAPRDPRVTEWERTHVVVSPDSLRIRAGMSIALFLYNLAHSGQADAWAFSARDLTTKDGPYDLPQGRRWLPRVIARPDGVTLLGGDQARFLPLLRQLFPRSVAARPGQVVVLLKGDGIRDLFQTVFGHALARAAVETFCDSLDPGTKADWVRQLEAVPPVLSGTPAPVDAPRGGGPTRTQVAHARGPLDEAAAARAASARRAWQRRMEDAPTGPGQAPPAAAWPGRPPSDRMKADGLAWVRRHRTTAVPLAWSPNGDLRAGTSVGQWIKYALNAMGGGPQQATPLAGEPLPEVRRHEAGLVIRFLHRNALPSADWTMESVAGALAWLTGSADVSMSEFVPSLPGDTPGGFELVLGADAAAGLLLSVFGFRFLQQAIQTIGNSLGTGLDFVPGPAVLRWMENLWARAMQLPRPVGMAA